MARSNSNHETVLITANKTVAIADCGVTQKATVDGIVFTLPSTAAGLSFRFENGGSQNGAVGFSISPAAADKIEGLGSAATDNKDVINTKATAKSDIDFIELTGNGTDGWIVRDYAGNWAREA